MDNLTDKIVVEVNVSLSKEEGEEWLYLINNHKEVLVKVLRCYIRGIRRHTENKSFFRWAFQALWMSFIVILCIGAFAPIIGSTPAQFLGAGLAAFAGRLALRTSYQIEDAVDKKDKKERPNENDS